MALDRDIESRIRAEAARRGADPDAAVAEANRLAGSEPLATGDSATAQRPTFERLLIGVLPFIRVRELRSIWLGLDEPLPDDDLTCGEFQAKYGGGAAAAPAADPEAQ